MGVALAAVILLFTLGAVVISFWLTAVTVVTGIRRLRFSLRTLLLMVFSGGACATLLTCPRGSAWFLIGALCTTVYVTAFATHLLGLGGMRESDFREGRQKQQEER
jgi:hypothetical protein